MTSPVVTDTQLYWSRELAIEMAKYDSDRMFAITKSKSNGPVRIKCLKTR